MIRILLLNTSINPEIVQWTTPERLRPLLPPDTKLEISWPRRWYQRIQNNRSFGEAVPHIMAQVTRHRKGYDAIVVNHHSDGGVEAVRDMVGVPVVGMGEAIVWLASYLVDNFSMVTFGEGMRRLDRNIVQRMGLLDRLVSIRVPLRELSQMEGGAFQEKNLPTTKEMIIQECMKAVVEDGAQAVILGGSVVGYIMPGITQEIQQRLAGEGYPTIPIIEPMSTALYLAKMLADLGLRRLP